jgi:hypothetical protein
MTESLPINFADRDDVRAKLPEAHRILDAKQTALNAAQEDWADWAAYVATLERRAGVRPEPERTVTTEERKPDGVLLEPPDGPPDLPVRASEGAPLDLVTEVVNREDRKIRAQDVAAILKQEGHDLAKVAVSNALFYAAKRAKPPRLKQAFGRGYYAPLSYQETVASPLTREQIEANPFLRGVDPSLLVVDNEP